MAYRYLIVGGGMTGDAAAKGIREHDADGSIVLVGAEPHPPYARPPLSKALWKGEDEDSIWRGTDEPGVDLRLGRDGSSRSTPTRTSRPTTTARRTATSALLLATGGRPRHAARRRRRGRLLPHARRLPAPARAGRGRRHSFVVIGGGFIGSEIAAALASNGCRGDDASSRRPAIGARLFPAEPRELRHRVLPRAGRRGARRRDGRERREERRLHRHAPTAGGRSTPTASSPGSGSSPRPSSRRRRASPVDNGIVVDELGRVGGRDDVFAAGDVARFPAPAARHRASASSTRTTPRRHGQAVGANMAGAERAVRPPAVLLLRPVRPRLRGGRRGRLAADDRRGAGRSRTARASSPTSTTRAAARLPALGRLGQGRRRDRR